jgi:23S rRNA (guanosine2251-2'-O)-methyltransferase
MITVAGAIAVKAALASRYRTVSEVFIQQDKEGRDVEYLAQMARQAHVTVSYVPASRIEQLTVSHTHGGIAATVSARRFQAVTSLLKQDKPFLALVQGVEDSFNLGYIIRTLYAMGCSGLILNERTWDFEDSTLIRSSAGASELLPIHLSSQLEVDLTVLKDNGIRIVSAYRGHQAVSLYETKLDNPLGILIAIGGPLRGLSQQVLSMSDQFVYIPYASDFHPALNAASAAAVFAGEVYRQNHPHQQ